MRIAQLAVLSALGTVIFLSGCATQLLSDDRIRNNTAGVIGAPADTITITDRHEELPNTYYTATVRNGKKVAMYACSINGGTLLDVGMVTAPTCSKK